MTFKQIVTNGLLGIGFPASALYVSRMDAVKEWLQVLTLAVGLLVSILVAINLCMKIRRRYLNDKETTTTTV